MTAHDSPWSLFDGSDGEDEDERSDASEGLPTAVDQSGVNKTAVTRTEGVEGGGGGGGGGNGAGEEDEVEELRTAAVFAECLRLLGPIAKVPRPLPVETG